MKGVTDWIKTKCKLEYLPIVSLHPDENVVKWYMDRIMEIANDLELGHIFVRVDEAIIYKILIISWIHQAKYGKIIPLIGDFIKFWWISRSYSKSMAVWVSMTGIQPMWFTCPQFPASLLVSCSKTLPTPGKHYCFHLLLQVYWFISSPFWSVWVSYGSSEFCS